MTTISRFIMIIFIAATVTAIGCEKETEEAKAEAQEQTDETPETEEEPVAKEEPKEEAEADDGTQWVTSESYGVKFRAPEDWQIKKNEEAISATSPDSTITVIVVGTESEGVFESAMGNVSKQLELSELKTEKSQMTVVNGLAGFEGRGSAVLKNEEGGQEIQFIGYALKLDKDKGIAMMIFAEAEMYEARKEEIEGIAKTIQKAS